MKGKRLYQLLEELNKTEHRQLLNICKKSSDKRSLYLADLLRKRYTNITGYATALAEIQHKLAIGAKDEEEQDKKLRRWCDYACMEVENLILFNQLNLDKNLRTKLLSNAYDQRNNPELTSYYNKFSILQSIEVNDLENLIAQYDIQLRWLSKKQYKEDFSIIENLLIKRQKAADLRYHELSSFFYSLLSGLYLDNPESKIISNILPDRNELIRLSIQSDDSYSRFLYDLSYLRMGFFKPQYFTKHIEEKIEEIRNAPISGNQKDRQLRTILFLKVIGGLYYGYPLGDLLASSEQIFEINTKYGYYDSVSFFFYLFFLLLDNRISQYDLLLRKFSKKYFQDENKDYFLFLQALRFYLLKDYGAALHNLMFLSYSHSIYLAAWSRLLEITIHLNYKDLKMANVLIGRLKRFLKLNQNHAVIYGPCTQVLAFIEMKMNAKHKQPSQFKNLFVYYTKIMG